MALIAPILFTSLYPYPLSCDLRASHAPLSPDKRSIYISLLHVTCFGHKWGRGDSVPARSVGLKRPRISACSFMFLLLAWAGHFWAILLNPGAEGATRKAELSHLSCSSWGQPSSASQLPAIPQPRAADSRHEGDSAYCCVPLRLCGRR